MADELGKMISHLWLRVRLFIENADEIQGAEQLNERDLVLLDYLEKRKEASFSELSAFFKKVSPSSMSNNLKKLHHKKLVARREDPKDLRSRIFSLTAKGRRYLEPVRQVQDDLSQIIADSLGLEPEQSELVIKAIERANQTFDQWMGLPGMLESGEPEENKPRR